MLQELNNFINIFKNFWGNQLNSLFSHLFVKGGGAQDLSDHLQKCMACFLQLGVNFHKKVWQKVSSKLEILEKDNSNALKLFNSWNIY